MEGGKGQERLPAPLPIQAFRTSHHPQFLMMILWDGSCYYCYFFKMSNLKVFKELIREHGKAGRTGPSETRRSLVCVPTPVPGAQSCARGRPSGSSRRQLPRARVPTRLSCSCLTLFTMPTFTSRCAVQEAGVWLESPIWNPGTGCEPSGTCCCCGSWSVGRYESGCFSRRSTLAQQIYT